MELLTREGLSYIASAIGIPLYKDKSTEQCRRIDVANICVEVTCDLPLPSTIEVGIEGVGQIEVKVIYPWMPDACSICKIFGHKDSRCLKVKQMWRPKAPVACG